MNGLNRRDFIKRSAGLFAAGVLAHRFGDGETRPLTAITRRPLGKTGLNPTLLGMGTGTKAGNGSSAQNRQGREPFLKTLIHAYERGLRYYDMGDSYGAHAYVKEAIRQVSMPRQELVLLTKTDSKEPDKVRADLDRFRKELDTDYLDIVLLHCLTDKEWPEKMKPCMDVLAEARQKGLIRAHGMSSHHIEALKRAAETPWVDVILARINPFGLHMDAKPDDVVPVLKKARENGKGVLGMKILAEGRKADRIDESLKFVLGLGCLDAITIGFLKPEEVDDTIGRIGAAIAAKA